VKLQGKPHPCTRNILITASSLVWRWSLPGQKLLCLAEFPHRKDSLLLQAKDSLGLNFETADEERAGLIDLDMDCNETIFSLENLL
jgi:hypothetical protein